MDSEGQRSGWYPGQVTTQWGRSTGSQAGAAVLPPVPPAAAGEHTRTRTRTRTQSQDGVPTGPPEQEEWTGQSVWADRRLEGIRWHLDI